MGKHSMKRLLFRCQSGLHLRALTKNNQSDIEAAVLPTCCNG